ncbi:MAG: hypothetical protein P8X89_21170 [Reinekea sp.]
MFPKNFNEPTGAPAIFEKQIEIKLLHPASTEGVTDSGLIPWGESLLDKNMAVPIVDRLIHHAKIFMLDRWGRLSLKAAD